jgi:hypothetical protein
MKVNAIKFVIFIYLIVTCIGKGKGKNEERGKENLSMSVVLFIY